MKIVISERNRRILNTLIKIGDEFFDGVTSILAGYVLGLVIMVLFFPGFAIDVNGLYLFSQLNIAPIHFMVSLLPFVLFWAIGNGFWNVIHSKKVIVFTLLKREAKP